MTMGIDKEERANRSRSVGKATTGGYDGLQDAAPNEEVCWCGVDQAVLSECIGEVTAAGDALLFAAGRHGTWLSITVMWEGDKRTMRANSYAEANKLLQDIAGMAHNRNSARGQPTRP